MPTVQTNDIETYYERRGEGPSIVFVHAAIADHSQWDQQADALSDEYTTIAYDIRGHGRTGGSTVDDYSVALFAEDLDALITALDLEKPVVCGLSLGGAIAQVYATTYPEKISGLVLADTFTPGDWRWPERLQWFMLRATIPLARFVGYERVERAMVWIHEQVRGKQASGDYETVEQLREETPTIPTEEFAKIVRSLVRFPGTTFDLSTVPVPAVVLYGEHEMGFVKRHAAKMGAEIPDARLQVVPGGAHASNLDEPEFFTTTLREFLTERVYSDVAEGVGSLTGLEKSG